MLGLMFRRSVEDIMCSKNVLDAFMSSQVFHVKIYRAGTPDLTIERYGSDLIIELRRLRGTEYKSDFEVDACVGSGEDWQIRAITSCRRGKELRLLPEHPGFEIEIRRLIKAINEAKYGQGRIIQFLSE